MLEYDGISELKKAAPKRLQDARELLEDPTFQPRGGDANQRHLCAAVYLAGYSVECALKAVIIDRTKPTKRGRRARTWTEVLAMREGRRPSLSGANSHNLQSLLTVSRLEDELHSYLDMKKSWGICRKWKPAWRYRPEPVGRKYAEEIVQACDDVLRWLRTQS